MIDIEEELKRAQIKYIEKEINQLRHLDFKFLQILCSYEEMLELVVTTDERLLLYKQMYQDSLNYIFKELEYNQQVIEDADNVKEY